jgi:hypothetical protein
MKRKTMKAVLLATAGILALAAPKTWAAARSDAAHGDAAPVALTGQNAVYALSLNRVRGHSVTGAAGRLRFDVLETCRAYTVSQTMTLLIRNQDGSLTRTVSEYDTWESKGGHHLSFMLRQTTDGKAEPASIGTATTGPKGGSVAYIEPKGRVLQLPPGTLFPMAHTREILQAAADGKAYIDPPLFDGTSRHGAEHTFVAILGQDPPRTSKFASISKLPAIKVDIGFFRRKLEDDSPDFRTEMRYYSNGVARNVKLDFGAFVVSGKLARLTTPAVACPHPPSVSRP